jgi:hypothetical protein
LIRSTTDRLTRPKSDSRTKSGRVLFRNPRVRAPFLSALNEHIVSFLNSDLVILNVGVFVLLVVLTMEAAGMRPSLRRSRGIGAAAP